MINRTLSIIAVAVILVLTGGLYWSSQVQQSAQADEAAVRAVVLQFGNNLNKVSSLSPTAGGEIAAAYRPYVSTALLASWQKSPAIAPGKLAPSPWPDHIDIHTVQKTESYYRVEGSIVLMTEQDKIQHTNSGFMPAHLIVSKSDDRWVISTFQSP